MILKFVLDLISNLIDMNIYTHEQMQNNLELSISFYNNIREMWNK